MRAMRLDGLMCSTFVVLLLVAALPACTKSDDKPKGEIASESVAAAEAIIEQRDQP